MTAATQTVILVHFSPSHFNPRAGCRIPECYVAVVEEGPDDEVGIQSRGTTVDDAVWGLKSELRRSSWESARVEKV